MAGNRRHAGAQTRRRSADRSGSGRVARGSEASAAQVSVTARLTGAFCRHGQAALAGGRVLQTRGGTGAHAWDGHGEDERGTTGRRAGVRASECAGGRQKGEQVDGQAKDGRRARAGGHVLRIADTAKRTVQRRVTCTARRWRDGRMGACCRHGTLQTRLRRRCECG